MAFILPATGLLKGVLPSSGSPSSPKINFSQDTPLMCQSLRSDSHWAAILGGLRLQGRVDVPKSTCSTHIHSHFLSPCCFESSPL